MAHVYRMTCLSVRVVDGRLETLMSTHPDIIKYDDSDTVLLRTAPIDDLPLERGRRYRLTLELDE